jgi:Protein of unknown function (DUF3309)
MRRRPWRGRRRLWRHRWRPSGPSDHVRAPASFVAEQGGEGMRLLLLIIVIILLIAALPTWPYSAGWGYYPGGILGLILIIVIVLLVLGRI